MFNVKTDPKVKAGYSFSGWSTKDLEAKRGPLTSFTMPDNAVTFTGSITPNTNTKYTVEHYLQNIEDDNYTIDEKATETLYGTTDTTATAYAKTYEGFTAKATSVSGNINGDGSQVLKLYYDRNLFTVTWQDENGTELEKDEGVRYGATPEFNGEKPTKAEEEYYEYPFSGWKNGENTYKETLPAVTGDTTYTATYEKTIKPQYLYNIANVTGYGYYRLPRQVIYAEEPVTNYFSNKIVPRTAYTTDPYKFGTIILEGIEFEYSPDGNFPQDDLNYYTVRNTDPDVTAIAGKISSSKKWLVPTEQQYDEPKNLDSFHRDFQIDLHFAPSKVQTLYNFLKVDLVNNTNYYRLNRTQIDAPPVEKVSMGKYTKNSFPYTFIGGDYNFEGANFEFNNVYYVYREKETTDLWYEPYFTAKPLDNEVKLYLNGKTADNSWYTDEKGWAHSEKDWEVPNEHLSYHRNYVAKLHVSEYTPVAVVANSMGLGTDDDPVITYDGTEHTAEGYKVYLLDGDRLGEELPGITFDDITAETTKTDAGEYVTTIEDVNLNNTKDTTNTYVIARVVTGTLKIGKRALKITAKAQEDYIYNAELQGESGAEAYTTDLDSKVDVDGLVEGKDSLTSITLKGQQINANTYEKEIMPGAAVVTNMNGTTATGNYDIEYVGGNLVIGKKDLKITAKAQEDYIYNAEYQGESGAEAYTTNLDSKVDVNGLIEGKDSLTSITLKGQQINANTYEKEIKPDAAVVTNENGKAATGNYEIEYVGGNLVIGKKPVTLTVASFTKTNDEADPTFTASWGENDLEEGDEISYTLSREEGTEPGTYAISTGFHNDENEALVADTTIENANYDVKVVPGTLTIQAKEILYNYISFDGGDHYISLNPSEIIAKSSAAQYLDGGTEPIEIAESEYSAEKYDLTGIRWYRVVTGEKKPYDPAKIYYPEQSKAQENEPYFTARLEKVVAANGAAYQTGTIEPVTSENGTEGPAFCRYYIADLSNLKMTNDQPLLTAIQVGATWYGVKWDDSFDAIDSRLIPFSHDLTADEYTLIEDFDFTNVVIKDSDGLEYYNVNSAKHAEDEKLPYYTTEFDHIRKTNNARVGGGTITQQATDNWKDIYGKHTTNPANRTTVRDWDKPGTDGYPYKAGFYHRDYKATLNSTPVNVKFVDYDGSLLLNKNYKYSTPASTVEKDAPKNLTRDGAPDLVYEFAGWDKVITDVTEDVVYTATYEITEARYTIHHYLNGTTIQTADDQTDLMAVGQTLTAEKSPSVYDRYATANVSGYADNASSITISEDPSENVITVYYQVPLTIEAIDQTAVYNGEAQGEAGTAAYTANLDTKVTVSGLLEGDELKSIILKGQQTNVKLNNEGKVRAYTDEIEPSAANIMTSNGANVTSGYAITYVKGDLTINQRPVTFEAVSETKEYTGDEIEITDLKVTETAANVGLVSGHTHNVTFSAKGTEASATPYTGTITAKDKVKILAGEEDVTANYDITVTNGNLTIVQTDVLLTVALEGATEVYNAEAHWLTKAARTNAVSGETTIEYSKAVAEGEEAVWVTDLKTLTATTVADSVRINVRATNPNFKNTAEAYANLTITPKPITLTVDNKTKVYGDKDPEFTASYAEGDLAGKDNVPYSFEREAGETVETYEIKATASDPNYTIKVVPGTLTIEPKKITITADNKTMIYGNAEPILTATTVGLVGTDYIATTQTRVAGKDIGEYTITTTVNEGQDIVKNYKIETLPGTLTINRRPVTVTAADKGKVYGEADPALTATVDGLATGESTDKIIYTLSRAAGENVGEYTITPSGAAEQGNYAVAYETGTLTIVPEDAVVVTITAHGDSFKYDGIEKDLSGYDVTTNNSLYTEADFTFTGSSELKGKNVGTYRTNMKASDFANANANFENVIFVVNNGTLNITPRSITLTSADGEKKYDSTALTNDTVTITGDEFVEGEGVNITVTGRQTAVGESENTFTYAMKSGTLAGNYEITTVYGKLKVTEAPATATGGTGNNAGTEEEEVTYHKLTITYQYEDGTVIKTFTQDYMSGTAYSVASGKVDGHTPDVAVVKGTMGNNDVNVTVTYSETEYTLTVKYVSLANGTEVAKAVTMKLKAGDNYTVFTPAVEGYTAQADKVTGEMPDSNRTITVFMTPDGAELGEGLGGSTGKGGGYNGVEIDDFGTPLGIADTILGGGEIIE